jgi:hypothetical protein
MRVRILSAAMLAASTALVAGSGIEAPADAGQSAQPSGSEKAAHAGLKPWSVVAAPNLGIVMPDMVRVGKRVYVVWSEFQGSTRTAKSRVLNASANPIAPARNVVAGWLTLSGDPQIFRHGNRLFTVFAGIRSSAPDEPYAGQASFATSPNGASWTLSHGSLSQTTAAGNSGSLDAIDGAGQPFFAMGDFDGHVIMHRGTDPGQPAGRPDFYSTLQSCCANVDVELANNRGTHQVWVSWYSLGSTDPDTAGLFAQKVWPRPNGKLFQAPGSANAMGQSSNPGQPALAERAGGGVWLAYKRGYPTSHVIRLWKVGTRTFHDFNTHSQIGTLDLATGPGGRLWLSWWALDDRTIRAVRTNPAVTRFGAVHKIPEPGGLNGQINHFTTEGSAGPLDVVAAAQPPGSGSSGVYATHILPGLTVTAKPKRLAQGRVTITVTDAGMPVRDARVTFRGHHAQTNAHGKAVLAVNRSVPDGRYPISVSKAGYAKSKAVIQVT